MLVLFDARPLQADPAGRSARFLAEFRAARPDADVHLLTRDDLPAPVAGLPTHPFAPPLPDTPANRDLNGLFLADWITALGPDVVVHPEPLGDLAPRYTAPRPRVVAAFADPAAALAGLTADAGPGVRLAAAADAVVAPSDAVRTLVGPGPAVLPDAAALARWLDSPPPVPAARRGRVAWAAPAPPAETGVADYALEVARALADRFDLEWVTDPHGPPPSAAVTARFRVVPADGFDARHAAAPFDLPVYHLGNNHFHTYLLPLMRRHPGLVVAHDTHTGGLFRRSHEAGVWPAGYEDEIDHNGEPLLAWWLRCKLVHPHVTPTYSSFARRPLHSAAGVLVHSAYGWREVRKVADAPACVVPHIATPPRLGTRADERRRLGLPADRFVVTTLGIVCEAKRPGVLLRAAAALPPDVRDRTRVVIVGPPEPEMREKLTALAGDLGIADRVEFRGRVPLEDFPAYAYAADVCVQLRWPCNGETSGALTRAMAAGACCVVSDTGAMAEVPNAVAPKVRTPARDADDLTAVLARLARDPAERDRLAAAARGYVTRTHSPAAVVAGYAAAISAAIRDRDAADGRWRVLAANALADVPGGVPDGLIERWADLRARAVLSCGTGL